MYMAVKHLHLLLVLLSVSFFVIRFVLSIKGSALLQRKLVKVLPHVIDTFLLVSAAVLVWLLQINPLEQLWLAEKIIAVVAYILLGVYAFKARTTMLRVFAFVGALGWLMLALRMVMTKTPFLLG